MDKARQVTPARTYVWINTETTPVAPTTATSAMGTGWVNVGHTTTDSMSFATDPNFEEVNSAQSDYPIRRVQTSDAASIEVDLLEWSEANFRVAFGGGTVEELAGSTGTFKYTPPTLGGHDDFSVVLEVIDGTKHYRYVFPSVMQVEGVTSELHKGSASVLALRLAVLGADGVAPWYLLTDDPAFDPAA